MALNQWIKSIEGGGWGGVNQIWGKRQVWNWTYFMCVGDSLRGSEMEGGQPGEKGKMRRPADVQHEIGGNKFGQDWIW